MCDGKCGGAKPAPLECGPATSDLAALRGATQRGAAGRFAVTDAKSSLPTLAPGSYLLHLESGDPAVSVSVSLAKGLDPIAADTTGMVDGRTTFPGGAVARITVLDAGETIQVQLLPSGSAADKLHINRIAAGCA